MDFPFRITEEFLFCRKCQQPQLHGIYAKEAYSIRGGILPKIPLNCICDFCKTSHLAFSQEFAFAKQNEENQDYTKIPGKNRLSIGNWIYIKGKPRPGIIKSLISVQQSKELTIDYGNGIIEKQKITNQDVPMNETALKGYRLLPYQSGETLIGDHIYHVRRDKFGKAIGLVHDGEIDKLVIHLEDETILFLTLPEAFQSLPNRRLEETARYKLKDVPESILQKIQLKAKNGILHLTGQVNSLLERRLILDKLNSIIAMRGIYNQLSIKPVNNLNDSALEDIIYRIFEDSEHNELVYYNVEVNQGKVQVRIGYYSENAIHYFEKKIEGLAGIIELSILPECVSIPTDVELKKMQEIENNLRRSGETQNKVYVRRTTDKIIISGRVNTIFQKKKIGFSVRNQNPFLLHTVTNNLRITNA